MQGSNDECVDDEDQCCTSQNDGIQGSVGFQGNPVRGFQGPIGYQGVDEDGMGVQGERGWQGIESIGPRGYQGPQGVANTVGLDGFQGITGLPGLDNWIGYQGPTGVQGPQGDSQTGLQGFVGTFPVVAVGPPGDVGFQDGLTYGKQGKSGPTQDETLNFEQTWYQNVFNLKAMIAPINFNGAVFTFGPRLVGSRHYLSVAFQITVLSFVAPVYIMLRYSGVDLTDTTHKFTPCANTPQHVLFQTFIDVPPLPGFAVDIIFWADQDNVPFELRDINSISIPIH